MNKIIITLLLCINLGITCKGMVTNQEKEEDIEWIQVLKEGLDKKYPIISPYDPEYHKEEDINTGKDFGSSMFDPNTINEYELQNLDSIRENNKQDFILNIILGVLLFIAIISIIIFFNKYKRGNNIITDK